eukprot:NODE_174_length_14184_cov_0.583671.p4 type:complete len:368 gc:universal NODE_174_length_14184_cov_0.583671:10663-11766(+)
MLYFVFALLLTIMVTGVGFLMFYLMRHHIVIKYRRPELVLVEQIFLLITACLETTKMDTISQEIPCKSISIPVSICGLTSLAFIMARITYVYGYLVSEKEGKISFQFMTRFFWDKEFKLKKLNFILLLGVWNVANILFNIFGYASIQENQTLDAICDRFPQTITYIANYLVGLFMILFSIQVIRLRVTDNIGMTYEFLSVTFFLIFCAVFVEFYNGVNPSNKIAYEYMVYTETMISMFFGLYFPMICLVFHKNKIQNYELMSCDKLNPNTNWTPILKTAQKFFCEENVLFCMRYFDYKEHKIGFENLNSQFLMESSPLELNISSEMRAKVQDAQERENAIDEIYEHITLLIKDNIMPYLNKNKESTV